MDLLGILYPFRSVKTRIEKYLLTKSTKNQNLPPNGKKTEKIGYRLKKMSLEGMVAKKSYLQVREMYSRG